MNCLRAAPSISIKSRSTATETGGICPVSPDLIFYFTSNSHPVIRADIGRQTGRGHNEPEEGFVHRDENILEKDRPAGGIKHTRTITAGKVIGIHPGPGNTDRQPIIVSYRNGIWYEVTDLPQGSVQDVWVQNEGGSPHFLIAVSQEGNLCIQHFGGQRYELAVPASQNSTSRKLLKVWGVSSEKFWVMDTSGTVWQRAGTDWRVVVRGLPSNITFVDAWVSPSGTAVAITSNEVYQLK